MSPSLSYRWNFESRLQTDVIWRACTSRVKYRTKFNMVTEESWGWRVCIDGKGATSGYHRCLSRHRTKRKGGHRKEEEEKTDVQTKKRSKIQGILFVSVWIISRNYSHGRCTKSLSEEENCFSQYVVAPCLFWLIAVIIRGIFHITGKCFLEILSVIAFP